ncbi:MAG TPA: glycosyl transferase [Rhodobiaceae bacterium]|nr:glycosyl transferase [Rhodobiaceae bacterium]|tara:strand:+ start:458 stop:1654 length:1197 start_codon:yes stop_codon:yes gene_type:complete
MTYTSGTAPNILQIIPRLDGGGAEATTLEMTKALTAAGGRSVVVSEGGKLSEAIIAAGGEIINAPVASKNPYIIYKNINRLAQIAKEQNIDILHARSRAPAWSSLWAAQKIGKPYLATYHSKVHDSPKLKILYNSVMTRGERVIANSEFTAARIGTVHKIAPEKIDIVPRGCDPTRFDPMHILDADIKKQRAAWRVEENEFVILCPARLTRWKGQMVLLEAVAGLKGNFRLILTGDTRDKTGEESRFAKELKARAFETGLSEKLVFAGHVANMPLAYAVADLAVLPSLDPEPFGRTAVEAQAATLPVIVSDAGGFRETVKEEDALSDSSTNRTGWRVSPGDVDALTDKLQTVANLSREELSAIGHTARQWVMENFTTEKMCEQTLQIYQSVIRDYHGA